MTASKADVESGQRKDGQNCGVRLRKVLVPMLVGALLTATISLAVRALMAFIATDDVAAGSAGFAHMQVPMLNAPAPAGSVNLSTSLHPSVLAQHGFGSNVNLILNPAGEGEEAAVILTVDPLTLSRPLQHDHQAGEALLVLKAPNALNAKSPPPLPPKRCSDDSGKPPPLGEVSGGAAAIFDDLTAAEVMAVAHAFMRATGAAKNPKQAKPGQEYITGTAGVELMLPEKAMALKALDEGGPLPPRFARVICARPLQNDVMEYRVGPITGSRDHPTVKEDVVALLKDGELPYTKRPPQVSASPADMDSDTALLLGTVMFELRGLLEEAFGPAFALFPSYDPVQAGTISGFPVFPDALESTSKKRVVLTKFFWSAVTPLASQLEDPGWLHPIPFVFKVIQPTSNSTTWSTGAFYFCGQGPFDSADALLAANKSGHLRRCKYQRPDVQHNSHPGDWDYPGPPPGAKNPRSSRRAPRQASPDGPRWAVSAVKGSQGRYVQWMGWEFFVSVRPRSGLALWDLRFKGRRIAYELSLQESAAIYGGGQGDQTYYLDGAMTGLGQTTMALQPGVDCPADASSFSNTAWGNDITSASSIASGCIFEEDAGAPLWTHITHDKKTMGVRNSMLVVRSVANSGNYDYYASVKFGLDGSVQWQSTLAGYCEARWFNPDINAWEQELSAMFHGDLALPGHSHLISVKVDLDIGDHDKNSFERMESTSGFPPLSKAAGVLDNKQPTKYIRRSYLEKETGFVANPMKPALMRVVNRDQSGPSSNSPPGYAIIPGETLRTVLPDSHPLVPPISYSKYTVAVTKYHDDEQYSTSIYDTYAPGEPHVSLDGYLANEESVEREDLVLWVSVPHEHIPRTEDVPLISNYNAGFKLVPWNMFDGHAAMDIPQDPLEQCLAVVE